MHVVPRASTPSSGQLSAALRAFANKAKEPARPDDLDARDETFIREVEPLLGLLYDLYFRCETEIEAAVPEGPFLAVGNHNAMTGIPDMFCHMVAFWREYSPSRVAYGLMHDMPFNFPGAGSWLNASGALAANPANAERALTRGAGVLVFPGGDLDACKPFRRRYDIDFGKRRGFIRLAIRSGVPIVPLVSVGGHHSLYIWSDGRKIAELLGLPRRMRSNVAPIGLALPWGLVAGVPYPHLPPPVKIHTRICSSIDLGLPPEAADDLATVERAYERVCGAMREAMQDLRQAGRHGLFPHR